MNVYTIAIAHIAQIGIEEREREKAEKCNSQMFSQYIIRDALNNIPLIIQFLIEKENASTDFMNTSGKQNVIRWFLLLIQRFTSTQSLLTEHTHTQKKTE